MLSLRCFHDNQTGREGCLVGIAQGSEDLLGDTDLQIFCAEVTAEGTVNEKT